MTNTGVWNGGSSPHQPATVSGQSQPWGPNLRRPIYLGADALVHMLVTARSSVMGIRLIDAMD